MEYIYMAIGILVGITILYLMVRKNAKKGKNYKQHRVNEDEGAKVERAMAGIDKSATAIVEEFQIAIYHEDSPLNRRTRRMVRRHYIKFLYTWPNLPPGLQDTVKIIEYLSNGPHNRNVVQGYIECPPVEKPKQ